MSDAPSKLFEIAGEAPEQLRPTESEISTASFCTVYLFLFSIIQAFLSPLLKDTGIELLFSLCNILAVATVAFIVARYRLRLRRVQVALDRQEVRSLDEGTPFALYLRPFVTGGRLLCRNTLDSAGERSILGRVWDAELNFAMALMGTMPFIAVGGRRTSYGAAKLLIDNEDWQTEVRRLARAAKLIIAVPMAKAGTLWEIRQIAEEEQVRLKTLFFMPPMLRRPARAWRRTRAHRKLWDEARHSLELERIYLPAYQRAGCLFVLGKDGHPLQTFSLGGFSTGGVRQLLQAVLGVDGVLDDERLRSALSRLPQPNEVGWLKRYIITRVTIGAMLWGTVAAWSVTLPFRTLGFEPFNIPSGSMVPTLLVGDYLFVSKFSYGYSRYSMPLAPNLFSGRILGRLPERGDVVVFAFPHDTSISYIKRVIGLPGDRIQMKAGQLYINNAIIPRILIGDYVEQEYGGSFTVRKYEETLPNGRKERILKLQDDGYLNDTPSYSVPPGYLFVLGDNRDNSADSRIMDRSGVGFVPIENVVGQASMIFFSISSSEETSAARWWPARIRWSRMFTSAFLH